MCFRAASISVKLLVGGDESVELSKTTALASQRRENRSALLTAEIAIILRGGEEEATVYFALKQKSRLGSVKGRKQEQNNNRARGYEFTKSVLDLTVFKKSKQMLKPSLGDNL